MIRFATLADLLAEKNGPVKKFYLLKDYREALERNSGMPVLKLREYGCDDLVRWLHPPEGARVRLTQAIDRFPDFIAPAGLTGTVVESTAHMFAVRMDAPLEGAEEWDNEVCWNLGDGMDDPLSEVELL